MTTGPLVIRRAARSGAARALLLATAALAAPAAAQEEFDHFRIVDDVHDDFVNLNQPPVRPLIVSDDFQEIFAVNPHDSTVVRFDASYSGTPTHAWRVPWNPVSIAEWTDPDAGAGEPAERLVVACRGSFCLVVMDRATGRILELLRLPSEPGDLLVDDAADRAFVSCSAVDVVVEVDLTGPAVAATYDIPSKHPLHMAWDGTDVLVAPMLSGNNSVVHKIGLGQGRQAQSKGILDLEVETTNPATDALPDEDVFRIVRATGAVVPVAKDVSTVLLGNAVNPVTQELWLLNVDLNNKNPAQQTEHDVRGDVSRNQVSFVDLATGASTAVGLDVRLPSGAVDPTRSLGKPVNLCFIPPGEPGAGFAYVVGALTDNVVLVDTAGAIVRRFSVVDGGIPRAVAVDHAQDRVLVYCWGTNTIEVHQHGAGGGFLASLDLGFDPLPQLVQEGRRVFYDASHSLGNNASCETCHVDGRTDMEEWNLSGLPADDKGPMVTQTLAGIDQVMTFHWRGEQLNGLIDFNPAFDNLLGGAQLDETPGGDFDAFEAFVLSLREIANPFEDDRRIVSNSHSPEFIPAGFPAFPGNAVRGQDLFFDVPTVGPFACADCHSMPTGTSGDIFQDAIGDPLPERDRFLVTAFNGMFRKRQPLHSVTFTAPQPGNMSNVQEYPLIGAGLSHAGAVTSLLRFSDILFDGQDAADCEAFVHQADSGIAPAGHEAVLVDATDVSTTGRRVALHLMPQAGRGNVDVVAFGEVTLTGGPRALRWLYDPAAGLFLPEDTSLAPRPITFFTDQAALGQASNVFCGVPVGMGERFGVDFDGDDLWNGDEAALGTDPFDVDTDSDGDWDGHEVRNAGDPLNSGVGSNDTTDPGIQRLRLDWIAARQAKISWRTDEPTTFDVSYGTTQGPVQVVSGDRPRKVHSVVLNRLLPGTADDTGALVRTFTYTGTLTARDLASRTATAPLPANMQTATFGEVLPPGGPLTVVLSALDWGPLAFAQAPNHGVLASATATVDFKIDGPPAQPAQGMLMIARVLVLPAGADVPVVSSTFTTSGHTTFTVANGPPPMPGPFLISTVSDASGQVSFQFTQLGLSAGDTVILNVEAGTVAPPGYDPMSATPPNFGGINRWSFADTRAPFRAIEVTVP